MASFALSTYQESILNFFTEHKAENMYINALAGCGKSSTACMLTEHSDTSDIYLAFNKSIAEEFKEKIKNPKTKVSTMHSLFYSVMNYNLNENNKPSAKLNGLKPYKILDEKIQKVYKYDKFEYKIFLKENYINLYNLCRLTCTSVKDENGVHQLIQDHSLFIDKQKKHYKIPSMKANIEMLEFFDKRNKEWFDEDSTIDFTDMLYITHEKLINGEWKIPFYSLYTNVYIDEAQDLSTIQLYLLKFIKRKTGRYVFILDRNQAIYGFAGSSCHCCEAIKNLFTPIIEFDLPINYRCPTSHLDLVNKLFDIPIQPRKDAPKGEIKTIDKSDIIKYIKDGDFIISRKNKWLADVIINLAKNNIPIYLEDKDFVSNIIKQVEKMKTPNLRELEQTIKNRILSYDDTLTKLNENKGFSDLEKERIVLDTNTEMDNLNFIGTILQNYKKTVPNGTVINFTTYIKKILNVIPNKNCVRVSSVHKAKGLEANNVFVLNEGKVCFDPRNSFDLNQQEKNLAYISLTRARNNMYLVRELSK